jgi:hypothetical protein
MTAFASLRLAVLVFLLSLIACDRLLARYALGHFIPEQRMRAALEAGPGCVVLAGDSRMVAGIELDTVKRGLEVGGRDDCVASIAIGALPIHGISVAVREYLRRGGRPRTLVLGASEDTLLPRAIPPDPTGFAGNEAISLAWSEAGDVGRLYPGFPFENVLVFDDGLRFSLARLTGFGTYASLVWQKVQAVQDRVSGRPRATNAFGAVADMDVLAEKMQATALGRLARTMSEPEPNRLDRAYSDIERRAQDAGAHFVVVELPMPDRYRDSVTESDAGRGYRAWFGERVARRAGTFIDLTQPAWRTPAVFGDFLHLNADGARHFSLDLGQALARLETTGNGGNLTAPEGAGAPR